MHRNGGVVALGDIGDTLGTDQTADQLLHLVGQGLLYFIRGGSTHPHQTAGKALLAGDARLFVAGDADAGDICLDHGGDQQVDAMTISVGLHDGADLRALVAEAILEGLDIVFKGAQIHFQPGVAGGLLLAVAMIRRKGQIGSRNGLAREQAEDQGSQQSFLVHGDSFLLFALDSLDGSATLVVV